MNIEFDSFGRPSTSPVVLLKPNRDRVGVLNEVYNINHANKFNTVKELTFSYPKYVIKNGKHIKNTYYDTLSGMKNIFIPDKGYYIITNVSEDIDGNTLIKNVTCYSSEFELSKKKLNLLSGTYKFYDPINLDNCIIGKALEPAKGWSVGEIDSDLWNIYRTFDINDTNVYNFLMNDVEEAYQCVFYFDTVNKKVSAKAFHNIIKETDIFLSFSNLMNNATLEENIDELVTCLKVYGSGNLSVHSVNPTGTAALYDFSYFKNTEWMSDELIAALTAWEEKYEQAKIDYSNLLVTLKNRNTELVVLNGELYDLEQALKTQETILKARVEVGMDASDVVDVIENLTLQIENKTKQINNVGVAVDKLTKQMTDINLSLAFEANFSDELLVELAPFIIENTYQNESFLTTTVMSEVEKQVMAENLYEIGLKTLDRLAQPRYTVTIDSVNYLYLQEFYKFTSQTELGCSITIELEDERRVELILLEIDTSEDNPDDFTLVFGNRYRIDSEELTFAELFGDVASIGNTISWDSVTWNEASAYIEDTVSSFISSALDCSKNAVINATNQEIMISEVGLRGRKATNGGYDNKQVWLTSNVLAFTKDNWKTSALALGEITMPDGSSAYGLVADAVVGKLIAGNQLTIANENSTFMVDGKGASLVNGSFIMQTASGNGKIILDPSQGIKIQGLNGKVLEDKFYVDNQGNVILKGSLTAGSTITGATFTGGSLNIGNGNFIVDEDGNVTAKNGTFSGTILADKISGKVSSGNIVDTLNNKALVGGSLNIGNGAFVVDSKGNVTIKNGNISWGAVTGTDAIDEAISDAQSTANSAYNKVGLLANGDYVGGTFINGESISSPKITGGTITGATIVSTSGNKRATLTNSKLTFRVDGSYSYDVGYIQAYDDGAGTKESAGHGLRIAGLWNGDGWNGGIQIQSSDYAGVSLYAGSDIFFWVDKGATKTSVKDILDRIDNASGGGTAVFG